MHAMLELPLQVASLMPHMYHKLRLPAGGDQDTVVHVAECTTEARFVAETYGMCHLLLVDWVVS